MKKLNNKGITLIALVITIIVMLILAGVTLNISINGGLLTQAQNSKIQTDREVEKEQLSSMVLGALDDNANFDIGLMKLPVGAKWIDGKGGKEKENQTNPSGNGNWIRTTSGNEFYIDGKGNILDENRITIPYENFSRK